MKMTAFLLLVSLGFFAAALTQPEFESLYWAGIAGLFGAALAFALDLLGSLRRRLSGKGSRRRPGARPLVVVDGSNVMYWKDNTPQIETIQAAVFELDRRGFEVGVIFDANAGYLLTDRYQHDQFFSRTLGLPQDRVMVVPKGTPADPFILTAARDMGARIVTNDRFRDWAQDFPEVRNEGFLIPGGYREEAFWFEGDAMPV